MWFKLAEKTDGKNDLGFPHVFSANLRYILSMILYRIFSIYI